MWNQFHDDLMFISVHIEHNCSNTPSAQLQQMQWVRTNIVNAKSQSRRITH